ncbi:hypothetical protein KC323_g211 [Hortaea werneckii]|nr:hypothetical protein KC323_g211 [Hortaea werneckii]
MPLPEFQCGTSRAWVDGQNALTLRDCRPKWLCDDVFALVIMAVTFESRAWRQRSGAVMSLQRPDCSREVQGRAGRRPLHLQRRRRFISSLKEIVPATLSRSIGARKPFLLDSTRACRGRGAAGEETRESLQFHARSGFRRTGRKQDPMPDERK